MRLHLPWKNKEDESGRAQEGRERKQEAEVREASLLEAKTAEKVAKDAVADARARGPEVQRLLDRVREMQQVNHIGERVAKALRDGYEGEAHGH
jgi:hypothetical protein